MSVREIIIIIALVAGFTVMFYQTIKLDPKKKIKARPVSVRVTAILFGIGQLSLAWLFAPEGSLIAKCALTLFSILYIYRALNGWMFKSKPETTPASSQSPE